MSRMTEYPYSNYHMFSANNLEVLCGKENNYTITFSKEGNIYKEACVLEPYNGFLDFIDDDFISYEVDNTTLILHLKACIYNDRYKQFLNEIADICKENKIDTLILDLSCNMGGSSAVIDEFIRHIDIETFYRYEMTDYSGEIPFTQVKRKDVVINKKYKNLFPQNILCKTKYTTFSSARTFAVTLKDNNLAKIIGSPTGGKPTSYGMPMKYNTPNFNIRFRVSRCKFSRPNPNRDEDISLFPDDFII